MLHLKPAAKAPAPAPETPSMGGSTSKPAAEAPAPAPETPSKAAARFCITYALLRAARARRQGPAAARTVSEWRSVAAAAAAERTEWTSPLVTD